MEAGTGVDVGRSAIDSVEVAVMEVMRGGADGLALPQLTKMNPTNKTKIVFLICLHTVFPFFVLTISN